MPSRQDRAEKLRKLAEIDVDDLLERATFDSVSPAICINPGCDYTTEMEPDQTRGWCEECAQNTVQSALILAGLI
jgi:hypothetical protein